MSEHSHEDSDQSTESFKPAVELVPHQVEAPLSHDAQVLDFAAAAERRRDVAREDVDRLAQPATSLEDAQTDPDVQPEQSADVIPIHRGSTLITPLEDQKGRDRLTEVRPHANALLGRMVQDKAFAKEIMRKKDLGTNYSEQGISEAMAAAALPYARRAMRASKRSNRFERMDLYKQASSDAANSVGRDMDLENLRQAAYESGRRLQVVNAAGRKVDYKPRKKPINYLQLRGLPGRFGIHIPALRRFK